MAREANQTVAKPRVTLDAMGAHLLVFVGDLQAKERMINSNQPAACRLAGED